MTTEIQNEAKYLVKKYGYKSLEVIEDIKSGISYRGNLSSYQSLAVDDYYCYLTQECKELLEK